MRKHRLVIPLVSFLVTSGWCIALEELPSVEELLALNEQARDRIANCSYDYSMNMICHDKKTGALRDERSWEGHNEVSGGFLRSDYKARIVSPIGTLELQREGTFVCGADHVAFAETESNGLNGSAGAFVAARYDHESFDDRSFQSRAHEEMRTQEITREAFGFFGEPLREFLGSEHMNESLRTVEEVRGPAGEVLLRASIADKDCLNGPSRTFDFNPEQDYLLVFMQTRTCSGSPILTYEIQNTEIEPGTWFPSSVSRVHELKDDKGERFVYNSRMFQASNIRIEPPTDESHFSLDSLAIPEGKSVAWTTADGRLTRFGMRIHNGKATPTNEVFGFPFEYAEVSK